jgi:hypothetical protein
VLDFARLRAGRALNFELHLGGAVLDDAPAGAFDFILLNDCLGQVELTVLPAMAKRLPSLCKVWGCIV